MGTGLRAACLGGAGFRTAGLIGTALAALFLFAQGAPAQEAPQAPATEAQAPAPAPAPAEDAAPAEQPAPTEEAAPAAPAAEEPQPAQEPAAAPPAAEGAAPAAEEPAPVEDTPPAETPAPAEEAAPAEQPPSPNIGVSYDWQMGFQEAVTPIMERIDSFHTFVSVIIIAIALFVLGLLIFVMLRFNAKKNPIPARTTHHTGLEIAWTIIPVLILVVIAIPSFRLLFAQYNFPPADMTIKAIGSQWYWTYEYPDHDNITFDALMVEEADLKPGQPRLLATDNDVVVPVGKNIHVLVTANDVIHDWAVPSFGVKLDAVPGRVMKTWFRAEKPGMYYGMCSELCGQRHAYMPIAVRVVTQEEFDAWLVQAKEQFARADTPKSEVARTQD